MPKMLFRTLSFCLVVLAVAVLAACGNDGDEDAPNEEDQEAAPPTQTALAQLPENMQEYTLTIEGGQMQGQGLTFEENESVVLQVENKDATAYRFEIEGLVTAQQIAPSTTTPVSFTTVGEGEMEARLLPAEGDQPVHTLNVKVQAAGGQT